jgi:hypothetical protein
MLALAAGVLVQPALAFQETTVGGQQKQAPTAPAVEAVKPTGPPAGTLDPSKAPDSGRGVNLTIPDVTLGKNSGTEVRIPGIGTVGVLPKLDFGLELLYGANETKGLPQDKGEQDDLQIRGTIKHRF